MATSFGVDVCGVCTCSMQAGLAEMEIGILSGWESCYTDIVQVSGDCSIGSQFPPLLFMFPLFMQLSSIFPPFLSLSLSYLKLLFHFNALFYLKPCRESYPPLIFILILVFLSCICSFQLLIHKPWGLLGFHVLLCHQYSLYQYFCFIIP